MGILTINTDFEKLWGEPEPKISFENSIYELTTEKGSDVSLKFSVLNEDNEDITEYCTITLNNSYVSVEKRDDGSYFVVGADMEVGEYVTVATATYIYKSAVVKAYADINVIIKSGAKYLTFEALESGTFSVSIPTNVSSTVTSISYSVDDGETWTECVPSESVYTTPTVQAGSKVLWKGTATALGYDRGDGTIFSSTGQFNVRGNIMSLLYGDDFADKTTLSGNYTFTGLFKNSVHLVDSKNLVLSATTLKASCYSNMFNGCTSLTSAPELPAKTVPNNGYSNMFQGCTSLASAPELPATTLQNGCYAYMFQGCTSLTSAPELPATTLALMGCYSNMFNGCTSLTSAPELPAKTLQNTCYAGMFQGCTSLTSAPVLPATTLNYNCYSGMFEGCTSLNSAPELPATTLQNGCYQRMFSGCTSLTSAPALPATTLASNCYVSMFQGCTSLTSAPALSATTLVNYCYQGMFQGCVNLNYIKAMFTTTPSDSYTKDWVSGVAATGTFVKNAAATWNVTGTSGIPSGWTVQLYPEQ